MLITAKVGARGAPVVRPSFNWLVRDWTRIQKMTSRWHKGWVKSVWLYVTIAILQLFLDIYKVGACVELMAQLFFFWPGIWWNVIWMCIHDRWFALLCKVPSQVLTRMRFYIALTVFIEHGWTTKNIEFPCGWLWYVRRNFLGQKEARNRLHHHHLRSMGHEIDDPCRMLFNKGRQVKWAYLFVHLG